MQELFIVRELQKSDVDAVLTLAMKSWKYTYKNIYAEDFIENYVNRAYRKEALENVVEQSKQELCKFYVLQDATFKTIAGFSQIGYDRYWEKGKKELPLRLFRIYINPKLLRNGLGKLLLQNVERFVKQEGQKSYIVGVHEKNSIGRNFYEKMGFKLTSKESDAEGEIYYEKTVK